MNSLGYPLLSLNANLLISETAKGAIAFYYNRPSQEGLGGSLPRLAGEDPT